MFKKAQAMIIGLLYLRAVRSGIKRDTINSGMTSHYLMDSSVFITFSAQLDLGKS